ncbi:MAG: pyridoxamine 5'-phosphate oxidase family protein [Haloarculaceae archaeon]
MDDVDFAYTRGLDETAVAELLGETGHGVLSLARNGEAYAIPVAYAFDGETFFVRLGMTPDSRKRAFVETTETACLVVYRAESTDAPQALATWSVVATGPLREPTEAERMAFPADELNRRFAPLRIFDEAIDEIDVELYALDPETLTGRTTE